MTTYETLIQLAQAGANVIHIASYEWERIRGHLIGLAEHKLHLPLWVWSQSRGLQRYNVGEEALGDGDGADDPIRLLQSILDGGEAGVWLLEDFHPFVREEEHQVLRWLREVARAPRSPRRVVVFSTPSPTLPVELRKEIPTLELELPDVEDLETVAEEVARQLSVELDADDALLEAARGLTVMEARLAYGRAAVERGRLDAGAIPLVTREKERVIRQSEVLEFCPVREQMSDIGGLEHLKTWLDRRGKAFGAGAREFGLDSPKGVLLLGVQGCGKSLTAKAVAAAWQFPMLRFDMGKVFGGIVGQSEANIRTALQVAQALAPCVLWIDEIEKGLAGMGSSDRADGGTTARVVGTLLTWMQEKREPVFVVATSNRIDMLPPELLRKGRFDEIFFVDLPTKSVREEILKIHLRKKHRDPEQFDVASLAEASVGFSGAELEEAVREGLYDAFAEGNALKTEDIARALKKTYPLSSTMRDQLEDLRRWAKIRARLASDSDPEPLPPESGGRAPTLQQERARNPFVPRERA